MLVTKFLKYFLFTKLFNKFPLLQKGLLCLRNEGFSKLIAKAAYYVRRNKSVLTFGVVQDDYQKWIQEKKLSEEKANRVLKDTSELKYRPKISIIMPVFDVDPRWLALAIESIENQVYENWELCIVDDCSTKQETVDLLRSIHNDKIKVSFLDKNQGISAASNKAFHMASGEYIGLMDHDDEITREALLEVAKAINEKAPDLIYSDEDKIDRNNVRGSPLFKPDWSPDLLRCQNYICHFAVIKKEIFTRITGFRPGFEGAQDHDLFLRISEKTDKIHHIHKVLYSWRQIETSTACTHLSKPYAQASGLKAVNAHLKRVYSDRAYADESRYQLVYDVRFPIKDKPLVSIIVPTKDNLACLNDCINSILAKSTYDNYEIILLDNNSEEAATKAWLANESEKYSNIRVISADYPFCWSRLNNHGISEANGDVYIFLNNDTEVVSNDWIERLAEQAMRNDAGFAGPLLLYEDGTIQHAGVVVGIGGWADHIFKGMKPIHIASPYVSPLVMRNVLAVTGSCLAVSKKTIDEIGRFDESFVVCGSDVEICLRAYERGLVNIYDPFVVLYHFESRTRVPDDIPECDFEMSRKHYKKYIEGSGDPYFNVNLSYRHTTPMLRELIC